MTKNLAFVGPGRAPVPEKLEALAGPIRLRPRDRPFHLRNELWPRLPEEFVLLTRNEDTRQKRRTILGSPLTLRIPTGFVSGDGRITRSPTLRSRAPLRFFLSVLRQGTVSGAAEGLGVDHTTVARRIQKLEKVLGARLFKRRITGYEPTAAAHNLQPAAEQMETAALTANLEFGDRDRSPRTVRIGAPDGFGSLFLAPRLHLLCERSPNLQIELVATARTFSLTKREADIAFSLNKPLQSRVIARKLTDYQLGLYASVDYLKSRPSISDKKHLSQHHFVGYIEDLLFTNELDYLPSVGKNISARFKSGNLIAQLRACLAGAGLAVLPVFAAHDLPQLRPVLPDVVKIVRTFYMQMHEDSRNVPWIKETAEYIAQVVRANRRLFIRSNK
jgi:DNA-binding transcriptional LysR family regulator